MIEIGYKICGSEHVPCPMRECEEGVELIINVLIFFFKIHLSSPEPTSLLVRYCIPLVQHPSCPSL